MMLLAAAIVCSRGTPRRRRPSAWPWGFSPLPSCFFEARVAGNVRRFFHASFSAKKAENLFMTVVRRHLQIILDGLRENKWLNRFFSRDRETDHRRRNEAKCLRGTLDDSGRRSPDSLFETGRAAGARLDAAWRLKRSHFALHSAFFAGSSLSSPPAAFKQFRSNLFLFSPYLNEVTRAFWAYRLVTFGLMAEERKCSSNQLMKIIKNFSLSVEKVSLLSLSYSPSSSEQ